MRWHLYCRVVDNFGDIGVAWRLAADLASRGEAVRLAVDDAAALAWMAPGGVPGVSVCAWSDVPESAPDVVVELFGGGLPDDAVGRAIETTPPAVVVNVEHLSAERYVERSHGLPSPRRTARGRPYTVWFFYPGFTPATGGLLREAGAMGDAGADRTEAWLATIGIATRPGERRVSLFCYERSAVAALVDALRCAPTLLLLAHGAATEQARAALGPAMETGSLRAVALPRLPQSDFDRLLRSCDLNLVRGEDSLVRAVWAGAPFVWQLYRQDDGVQHAKLAAFLDLFLAGASPALASAVRRLFARWNDGGDGAIGLAPLLGPLLGPLLREWIAQCRRWREGLAARDDLTTELIRFVASKR